MFSPSFSLGMLFCQGHGHEKFSLWNFDTWRSTTTAPPPPIPVQWRNFEVTNSMQQADPSIFAHSYIQAKYYVDQLLCHTNNTSDPPRPGNPLFCTYSDISWSIRNFPSPHDSGRQIGKLAHFPKAPLFNAYNIRLPLPTSATNFRTLYV